jgi:hypothetical protein
MSFQSNQPRSKRSKEQAALERLRLNGVFGLEMSDEAYGQFEKAFGRQRAVNAFVQSYRNPAEADKSVDIFIHGEQVPFLGEMIHEFWHLIEDRAGVLDASQLIVEGTATYVQNTLAGIPNYHRHFPSYSLNWVLYDLGAALVKEEMQKYGGDLKLLLDPVFRERLQKRFDVEALSLYFERAVLEVDEEELESIQYDPKKSALVEDPNKGTIINYYDSIGATLFAEELKGQNPSKLVSHYQRLRANMASSNTATARPSYSSQRIPT